MSDVRLRQRLVAGTAYRLMAGLLLLAARDAAAHQDPSGCFQSGPAITIAVLRDTGTCGGGPTPGATCTDFFVTGGQCGTGGTCNPVGISGQVTACETINYVVSLSKSNPTDTTICAFQGGTLTLTTPDGVVHTVNPSVPCLGGTLTSTEDCSLTACSGNPCSTHAVIPYTVRSQDIVSGFITAGGNYGPGILHDNTPDTTSPPVTATTPKSTPVMTCNDHLVCNGVETCDPTQHVGICSDASPANNPEQFCTATNLTRCTNPATATCTINNTRLGACIPGTPLDCGQTNGCAQKGCVEPTGCFDNTNNGCKAVLNGCENANCDTSAPTFPTCFDNTNNGCKAVLNGCENANCDASAPTFPTCFDHQVTCPPSANSCMVLQCNPVTGMCEDSGGTGGGFPFLVRSQGQVGNGSQVLASFGANDAGGLLQLGKSSFVSDGNTVAGDSVNLLINTNVFDVLANHLRKGTGVKVRGAVGTPVLPLTNPFCPIPPLDCTGGVNQIVPRAATLTLGPGTYGQLLVINGGTLILTPAGTFTFCSLQTNRGVTIVVSGATASTINVVGTFRLANTSSMLPVNTTPTPFLNVGGNRLRIGAGSTIQAFISAPNAHAAFGHKSKITGSFCVDSSQSDKGITLMCPTTTTTSVTTTTMTRSPG